MLQPSALVFGRSPAMRTLLEQAEHLAPQRYPLLILGERGTGKSVLARYIHARSGREGPLIEESVSGLQPQLELAELVGHARGAFTGAVTDQIGLIEAAHRGTFFLDEIGNASVAVQQILLRLLERQAVRRIREARDRPVDVRFLAATNADLSAAILRGDFRADLKDRFGPFVLSVPSLRERRDEVLPLAHYFVEREAAALGFSAPPALGSEVCDALLAARWPGNVRELEQVCQFAVCWAEPGGEIGLGHLPPTFVAPLGPVLQRRHDRSRAAEARRRLRQQKLADVRDALARTGGNKTRAARLLRISRQQVHRILAAAAAGALGLGDVLVDLVCNVSSCLG
jgi:DNA-binding NtrC family response regulator